MLEQQRERAEDGGHRKTYRTALETVRFEVEDGGFTVDIELRREVVEQFSEVWTDDEE